MPEGFFKRGLFVFNRSGTGGAKKKYALIDNKIKLKIRGFETVRRDWCTLARKLQSEILMKLLSEGNEKSSLELLKKTVTELKERNINLEDLMIRTKLKKPLDAYIARGPHVVAAEKMVAAGVNVNPGMIINYFIGEINKKSKKIGDKVFLEGERQKTLF